MNKQHEKTDNLTESFEKKAQKAERNEAILTSIGVVFILILTVSTVYSFESRNARIIDTLTASASIAGARG